MRQRLLFALLLALAALIGLGAWKIAHDAPDAALGASASSPEALAQRGPEVALETNALPEERREEAVATKPAGPCRIRGRVVCGSPPRPMAGIEVRCAKQLPPQRVESGSLRLEELSRPAKELSHRSRISNTDGAFEFDELERGAEYLLDARGNGWLSIAPLADVTPSEEQLTLAVQRVYEASVLAVGEDGKLLGRGCEFLRYARVAGPGECESRPLPPALERELRELRLPQPGVEQPGEARREYRFASDCVDARLGPFRVRVDCAGFERQDFEFWAYPEGSGASPTTFTLQRGTATTGTLRALQDCGCQESACAHLVEGLVELQPADPSETARAFELTGLAREQVFRNLPAGTWRVRVKARAGGYQYPPAGEPPLEIVVGSDTADLRIPVGRLGALRWKLRGPGEELPREAVPLRWQSDGADSSCALWMSVVMRGLEPGPQTFEIDADKVASLEGASGVVVGARQRISVEISAGETKLVVVHSP